MNEWQAEYGADQVKREGAIEELDRELNELDEAVERLVQRVGPITNQYGGQEARLSEPKPEPATQLRGRIERLRARRERLIRLSGEIDL